MVTALPKMAADPVRTAHVEPIASLEVMQRSAEFLRVVGTEEQVNVIRHKAVVMDLSLVKGGGGSQEPQVAGVICCLSKNSLTVATSGHHMVEACFGPRMGMSSHNKQLYCFIDKHATPAW